MTSLRILAVVGLAASSLALSSCTSASTSTSTTSTTAAASVMNCTPAHLKVSLGVFQGAAGTIYYPIIFTNLGAPCVLWGVPKVQPVVGGASHSHLKVGPSARNGAIGQMPARHVLKTGNSVSDAFGVSESGNYTPSDCRAKYAGAIVVSMGAFVRSAYVPLRISVCTKLASTTTRLIVAGTSGT